jgi:hypothetical protein
MNDMGFKLSVPDINVVCLERRGRTARRSIFGSFIHRVGHQTLQYTFTMHLGHIIAKSIELFIY